MNISRYTICLIAIVLIGFTMRVWQLGNVPPSPNWDEVALGYNAYSLLHTGTDEYGKFLPAVLRSYDDYKPAAYAYFLIPSVAVFGLNVFAVRFPAAIFATMAILAVYFLIKELFHKKAIEVGGKEIKTEVLALLTAFLLAISPWHLQFSRIAFESNVGVAFNIFAVLFFLIGLRKPVFLLLSAFCFGITPSIYQSDKVFTPILFLIAFFLYRKDVMKVPRRYLILSILVGMITLFPPLWFQLTDKQALARAQGVSIFANQTEFLKGTSVKLLDDSSRGDALGLLFNNRRVEFAKAIVYGYISHFSLNWLFVHGDLPRHHAPFFGLLYLWELPLLFIGIYAVFFGKFERRIKLLVFLWFFAAPIPASITSGVPHAVRTLNFLPIFQIFSAFGLLTSVIFLWKQGDMGIRRFGAYAIVIIYSIFILMNTVFFLNEYYVQQNYYTSVDWQYGYSQAVSFVKESEKKYSRIIVTNKPPLDQSYMFFLFHLQYPPAKYLEESQLDRSGGFKENHIFGKYQFRPIDWKNEQKNSSTLYVGRPSDFPSDIKVLKEVKYLNGEIAIRLVEAEE